MITISAESNAVINAIPPSIQNVIIMGNKDQIVFYTTQKSPIVLSYSTTSKRKVLSMNVDIATSHATIDSCLTSQIAQLRASCVEFACGIVTSMSLFKADMDRQRQKTVATGALPPVSPGIDLLLTI